MRGKDTVDVWTCSRAWNKRPQGKKLQNKSKRDWMYNHQDERHMGSVPISVDEYPRNKIAKNSTTLTGDKVNEFIECFAQLHNHEHLNEGRTLCQELCSHQNT